MLLPFMLTGVILFDFSTQEEAMKDEEYHRLFVDVIDRSLPHIIITSLMPSSPLCLS